MRQGASDEFDNLLLEKLSWSAAFSGHRNWVKSNRSTYDVQPGVICLQAVLRRVSVYVLTGVLAHQHAHPARQQLLPGAAGTVSCAASAVMGRCQLLSAAVHQRLIPLQLPHCCHSECPLFTSLCSQRSFMLHGAPCLTRLL